MDWKEEPSVPKNFCQRISFECISQKSNVSQQTQKLELNGEQLNLLDPGREVCFSKNPVITPTESCCVCIQGQEFNSFADNVITLSINKTKWTGL